MRIQFDPYADRLLPLKATGSMLPNRYFFNKFNQNKHPWFKSVSSDNALKQLSDRNKETFKAMYLFVEYEWSTHISDNTAQGDIEKANLNAIVQGR